MIKVWLLFAIGLVMVLLPYGDAKCCASRAKKVNIGVNKGGANAGWNPICGDCTLPTPCCATGRCNMFCCNCAGRCREGCRVKRFYDDLAPEPITQAEASSSALDVISAADIDGDGRMSLEEAHEHLSNNGLPAHRVKRSLMEMDLDNDDFLSPQEIDPIGDYQY